MGDELVASEGLYDPARGWDFADDTSPTAGEYIATHLDLQGISTAQLQTLKDRLTATQGKLQTQQFPALTKEDIAGDVLYSAVLSYFAVNQATAQVTARASGMVEYRKPSFGNFLANAKPLYWFGISRSVSFPSVTMDINRYATMNVARDNNTDTAVAYNRQSGIRESAYEHLIPEKLFIDPADFNHPQGISAVKALALAANQGQKIYTFNAQNQALLTQINIDPQAMSEIQNALAAGKEVTVHQVPITQSGWTGSGYVITDPATGAGAYKISGGANGGALPIFAAALSGLVDSLAEKLRNPNHVNGPLDELNRAYWIKKAAQGATLLTFVIGIADIFNNDKLSPAQRVLQITALLVLTIAANVGAAWLGIMLFNPVGAVGLAVFLAIGLAIVNNWVNDMIVEINF
jgi:hypothetical protein